jgi:hypothetical protein
LAHPARYALCRQADAFALGVAQRAQCGSSDGYGRIAPCGCTVAVLSPLIGGGKAMRCSSVKASTGELPPVAREGRIEVTKSFSDGSSGTSRRSTNHPRRLHHAAPLRLNAWRRIMKT